MAYPITQEVLDLFTTQHRQIVDITFKGVAETKTLTEKDVIQGGLSIDRYCVSGSRIEIGSAVAAELSLTLDNTDGKFNDTAFEGAELFINVGTKKWEARKWEKAVEHFIPMGYFTVDNSPRKLSNITLSALDRMVYFDKDVEPEKLSFPMTVGNLLEQICNICNVELATDILTLINQDYVINEYPQGNDLIYRQLLMWIAEITGTCAYIDWEGKLRLEWYKTESSARIDASMRFSSDLLENALTISGVRIKVSDEENVLCGDESYALLIEGNSLIQHDSETLAQSIYSKVGGFTYTPYECIAKPFVNLYPLDSIVFVDKDGVEVPTVVTNTTFLINGNIGISAKGETATNDGYASANPLTKQEAFIIEKVKKEANKNLSENVQSILSFNELISNALGIYATVVTDKSGGKQYYMHDSPNLEDSNTIYTLNTGGFAYTNSGWNNGNPVWQYGFDKNGNAIYKKVCAYGMEVSNPNGSYSATISPDAFKIWQDAVLLLDASKEGLKIFNGGITIFKGVGSSAKKAMYFDADGNIALDGYLTQIDSPYRALIGYDEQNHGGFYIYDRRPNYLRNDGTYKPYISMWSSSDYKSVITGTNELRFMVSTIANEHEGNYSTLTITPTGSYLYGAWDFGQDQFFTRLIGSNTAFVLQDGDTRYGSFYHFSDGRVCLKSDYGEDLLLSVGNYTLMEVKSTGGALWGAWYLGNSTAITSDENKKNSIEQLPEKYSELFDNLRPVRYKYNEGTSDRFHTGFIAQEVEQALTDSEIDSQEFAGFVKNEDGECFLRYEEFIALAVNEVQTLKKKNSDLEQRVADLENKLETLLNKSGGEANG